MIAMEVSSTGKKRRGRIVSILFQKPRWTIKKASAWGREHGFYFDFYEYPKFIHGDVGPVRKGDRVRTVPFGKGIEARIAFRGPRR